MEKIYHYTRDDYDMIETAFDLYGKKVADKVRQAFKENKSPIYIQNILAEARKNMK